jgi:hypothetical protein
MIPPYHRHSAGCTSCGIIAALGRSEPSYPKVMPNFKGLWETDGPPFELF